ncbi:hypothetical protein [Bradyrhizobium guangzhouense]|uniref:Uncharacterized protein n=1 Tax=Bradyrhizobium guangzhouense TaxID=1325095 RepID=A0AAE6C620_9BRAD|nr:hypothetical protein [Bradyrhizobium guangzhouense]QAU44184.1 hypothetical protein XH91_01640 [Bradyrhizobium guangzhouense]
MQNPQDGWIPLGRAIFRFGVADTKVAALNEPVGADLFSVGAFEQSKSDDGVSQVRYEPELSTLEDLTVLLREKAGASNAEIDRESGRFLFFFLSPGGGVTCHGGTPWAILREADESLKPRLEALLSSSGLASEYEAPYVGFAKIEDDQAVEGARQSERVRFATGLVWRRFLLPAFDRAVKARRVKLFARWPSTGDDVQELPSDIWPLLEVVDWEHGVARGIDGMLYSSIHVADSNDASAISDEPTSPAHHLKIRQAAKALWPNGDMPASVKERDAAICAWFGEKSQHAPSSRTIRRALATSPAFGPGGLPKS